MLAPRLIRPASGAPRPRCFTLIELLVVVTIIAILAAMLLPAMSRARELARQASCMSQLRQLGLAAYSYAADYEQYPQGVTTRSWGDPTNLRDWVGNGLGSYGAQPTLNGLWSCPSTSDYRFTAKTAFEEGNWSVSYIYIAEGDAKHLENDPSCTVGGPWVSTVGGYPNRTTWRGEVGSAADTIVAMDRITWRGLGYTNAGFQANHGGPGFEATGRVQAQNTLFGDGHVAKRRNGDGLSQMLDYTAIGGNWRFNTRPDNFTFHFVYWW